MIQIKNLIIWPKDKQFTPQQINFKIGKLNVITGLSRTGKSAIIPIIDYCLASSDCFIPIDTIRDHACWYGITIVTDSEQILIARQVPNGKKVSNNFHIQRGQEAITIPTSIDENSKILEVKLMLNKIISAPFFGIEDDSLSFGSRLSIRDLMALVFQSQEVVANQNILFYKTHAHEHRERLRNWFPYILGAETLKVLKARNELKTIEVQLKRLVREYESIKNISEKWLANIKGLINIANEYGLIEEELNLNVPIDNLIITAQKVLSNIPNIPNTQTKNINRFNKEIFDLEKEDDKLSNSIATIQKRLKEVENLHKNFLDYGKGVKKRADRLHLSKWLNDISLESTICPICGSTKHEDADEEIKKVCISFEEQELLSKKTMEIPTSFSREETLLKRELDSIFEHRNALKKRLDLILSKDKNSKNEFHKKKEMFLFLGQLKTTLEIIESISDSGELKEKIDILNKRKSELLKVTNKNFIQTLVKDKTNNIATKMLSHLKELDVEEKYKEKMPIFSIEDLSIKVMSDDGNWHFLAEVGSASNWVSFHLALFCSLQEFFIESNNSLVPNFVIFDQPSQVYFPKVNNNDDIDSDDIEYENEDVEAVRSMFKVIADSIKKYEGKWQAIILDHADKSIYGTIDEIHEVDEWRNGKKLIPVEWYENDKNITKPWK